MSNNMQIDFFSIIDSAIRARSIKYDFHHKLVELGFHCNRVGKSYHRRVFYKDYFIDFLFKTDYPECYFGNISYSKEIHGYPFKNISFITNDDIGKMIFFDDEILTYPTYLLSFEDLLNQFVMRYKNVASESDKNYRDELYRIKDEDCFRRAK